MMKILGKIAVLVVAIVACGCALGQRPATIPKCQSSADLYLF